MASGNYKLIREEQDILDSVINVLDNEILRLNKEWDRKDLDSKKQIDKCLPDTYGALVQDQDDKKWLAERTDEVQLRRDSLYNYRLEVVSTENYKDNNAKPKKENLKVGLHEFGLKGDIIISSWTTPVCRNFLLNKDLQEFIYNPNNQDGIKYTLQLKRRINFDYNQVTKAVQLFPADEQLSQIIYDDFLNDILKRHSDSDFRNIVFSIQKEQAEIIQSPFENNIIVQGCAGSGKSMIMLHRLPVLLYDNKSTLSRNNIYIITPSDSYIQMARSMLRELEISNLPIGTLDEYYEDLLSRYGRNIKDCGEQITSERLNKQKEQYVYSSECTKEIIKYMSSAIEKEEMDYSECVDLFSLQWNLWRELDIERSRSFEERVNDNLIISRRILEANSSVFLKYLEHIYQAVVSTRRLRDELKNLNNQFLNRIEETLYTAKRKLLSVSDEIEELQKKPLTNKIDKQIKNAQKSQKKQQKLIDKCTSQRQVLLDPEFEAKIENIISDLDSTLKIYEDFNDDYKSYINNWEASYEFISKRDIFADEFSIAFHKINELIEEYHSILTSLKVLSEADDAVKRMRKCETAFLDKDSFQNVTKSNLRFEQLQKCLISKTYEEVLIKIGQQADENGNFKRFYFSPYLYLQILYQYQGAPNSASESLVTIDEAQSLSFEEIKLIRKVNRDNVVLNLFGDVNQHFEGTKGIDDWSDLTIEMPEFQVYNIKENYRNTCQITEYCNKRFHLDMDSLNLDGPDVEEYKAIDDIILALQNYQGEGPFAIIVSDFRDVKFIKNSFKDVENFRINDMTVKSHKINNEEWNLMTVEQARGLEFSTVMVLASNMTTNQKYVACTRALNKLYVFDDSILPLNEPENISVGVVDLLK